MKHLFALLLASFGCVAGAADLYLCDWTQAAPRFWTAKAPFAVSAEEGVSFLRVREADPAQYNFNFRTMVAGTLGTDYKFSFRFRLGAIPADLVSGDGAIASISLNGKDSYIGMTLMDAHFNGGTWFINGFGLREKGKMTDFAKTVRKDDIFSTSGKVKVKADTAWHTLTFEVRKGSLRILMDENILFEGEDPRIAFDQSISLRPETARRLGHIDFGAFKIETIE